MTEQQLNRIYRQRTRDTLLLGLLLLLAMIGLWQGMEADAKYQQQQDRTAKARAMGLR